MSEDHKNEILPCGTRQDLVSAWPIFTFHVDHKPGSDRLSVPFKGEGTGGDDPLS